VEVTMPEKDVLVIPTEALYRDPEHDRNQVFAVENGRVKVIEVKRLFSIGDDLVIEGLTEGMAVITGGKGRVEANQQVHIIE